MLLKFENRHRFDTICGENKLSFEGSPEVTLRTLGSLPTLGRRSAELPDFVGALKLNLVASIEAMLSWGDEQGYHDLRDAETGERRRPKWRDPFDIS